MSNNRHAKFLNFIYGFCWLLMLIFASLSSLRTANAAQPSGSVIKQQMLMQVVPTSNALFAVANQPPETAKAWSDLKTQVLNLNAAAKWLQARRVKDKQVQWRQLTADFQKVTVIAVKAVSSKQPDTVSDAGDAVYAVCESCHKVFLTKVVNEKSAK